MILALLLAGQTPMTPVEAERAFAADAQKLGQWTAFRKWAAPEAIMFMPQPLRVQQWLKDRPDPAVSVAWEPVQVWRSCDGSMAVTTGYAYWPNKSVGWFTTIWKRQPDGGWRWVLDHGDILGPATLGNRRFENSSANCRRKAPKLQSQPTHGYEPMGDGGYSADRTLRYYWTAEPKPPAVGGRTTWSHQLVVALWNGADWSRVLTEWVTEKP